jgi:uncharacterized protein (DUF362 family)
MKTLAIAILLVAGNALAGRGAEATAKSQVVLVRDAGAVSGFNADPAKARAMVSAGIRKLTGQATDAAAWGTLVSSNDIVGIKINTQAGPLHRTRREVVEAIAEGLQSAGVTASNILVWDRDGAKMRAAGYPAQRGGAGIGFVSVVPDTGWDEMVFFQNNITGKLIWGDLLFNRDAEHLSNRSHLPRIVTRTITKLINAPALQDHDSCGIAGCLYNVTLGAADNTRRFENLLIHGDPVIAEIAAIPLLRDKIVLHVMDALLGGYAGGPTFKPQYSWKPGSLYMSRDPVAIDALCVELLEAKRREAKIPEIGSRASHIRAAALLKLGQSERASIELIEAAP